LLTWQHTSSSSPVGQVATPDVAQPQIGPRDIGASATQVRQSVTTVQSTLPTVSVTRTKPPSIFVPDALAPTFTAEAESISIAVLAVLGGSLAAAAVATALLWRRPGKHRG
jgi:hypothetical protein